MTTLRERDPFRVGLVAIGVVVVLGLVVVLLSVIHLGARSYTAVLENSAGLRTGESVEVHGVVEGEVTAVELVDDTVVVHFTVDHAIPLGGQTTAAVKVATLLGTHYLEVDPSVGGELAGAQIPLERTSVPYNLQDVLNRGTRKLEQLRPVELARALTAVSRTLDRAGPEVGPALDGVARLSQVITRRSEQTGALLRAARGVTGQLDRSSRDLIGLMRQTNLVVEEVARRRAAIHRLLVEATGLGSALRALVRETDADLTPSLRDIGLALDSLNQQDRDLRHVLSVMAPALRYLANTAGNGRYLDLNAPSPAVISDEQRCGSGDCG